MAIRISIASPKNVSDAVDALSTSVDTKLDDKLDKATAESDYIKKENLDVDLAEYAKKTDLEDYAKASDLDPYMKTADADAKYETLEQAAIDHALYAQKAYVDETFCKIPDYTKTEDLAAVALTNDYADLLNTPEIVDELTSEDAAKVLSAKQGKVLKEAIQAMAGGIKFKGTVGEGGTIEWSALPAASEENNGWEYKVITDHAEAPACEAGDYVISTGAAWVIDPMVDESFELKSNKVNVLSSASTDDEYPTAKATYEGLVSKLDANKLVTTLDAATDGTVPSSLTVSTALNAKVAKADIDTAVNEGSTDEKIPSAKAVYSAIKAVKDSALTQDDIEQALSIAEDTVPSSALLNAQLSGKLNTSDVLSEMPSTPTNATVLGAQALADLLSGKLGTDAIDTTVPADPADASDTRVPSTKSISSLAVMLETALDDKQDKLTLDDTTKLVATLEDGSEVELNVVTI